MSLRRRGSVCLAGALVAWVLLTGGCQRRSEPPRSIPSDWRIWDQGAVSFRFPPQYTVATEDTGMSGRRIFVSDDREAGRLILYLVIGDALPFPLKHADPALPRKSIPVRIAGHPAERCGPISGPAGATSEGLIDLGGKGPSAGALFYYTKLEPGHQEIAETIVASIQGRP